MGVVALVVACGIAAQSPIFVSFGVQPTCSAPAVEDVALGSTRSDDLVDRWAAEIAAAANRLGVQPQWISVIMRAESGGIPSATSPAGAMGLMQIMPATWNEMRRRYGSGTDPYRPADNILGGAAYMRELLDRYGSPGFLAAYNAGPGRLDDYLLTRRPLPDETRQYVATVGPQLVADTSFRWLLGVESLNPGEIRGPDQAPQRSIGGLTSSGLFVQPANTSAAMAMESARSVDAADAFDSRSREGLFVPLCGQSRIP
jgi:hypothetical protein